MSTPYLGIAHIAANQNQPEVTANSAFDALDGADNGLLSVAMADADQTPTAANYYANGIFECTGALTADRHLIVPNTKRRFIVNNKTTGGHNIIVETAAPAGTAIVAAGTPQLVYCDGADNIVAVS
jgi:hypothetical protein